MNTEIIAIYSNETKDIDAVYTFAQKQNKDVAIFTDNQDLKTNKKYAILASFYLRFCKDIVVFMSIEDYLEKHKLLHTGTSIYIRASIKDLLDHNIARSQIKNVKFISIESNEVNIL
jgi:hypothetical protein